ncbi:Ubiquinone biosynthesis protein [Balamuthia mandrillaris]
MQTRRALGEVATATRVFQASCKPKSATNRLCSSPLWRNSAFLSSHPFFSTSAKQGSSSSSSDNHPSSSSSLYPNHVQLSPFQKALMTFGSAFMALARPERMDMVAALGETTGDYALGQMLQAMRKDPEGQEILLERPRVRENSVDLEMLSKLPAGSFGKEYVEWLRAEGFSPDKRPQVRFVDDEELAYVMTRYREVHDFLHLLVGLPPTVLGEIALKWYEMYQMSYKASFPLPMSVLSSFVGPLRLSFSEQSELRSKYIPWAKASAQQTPHFFMNIYYERLFEENLEELRKRMRIVPFPGVM